MMRYEYKVLSFGSGAKPNEIESAMNSLGADGWLVVDVDTHAHGKAVVMMRMAEAAVSPIAAARRAS
jgi:hypothetical protein